MCKTGLKDQASKLIVIELNDEDLQPKVKLGYRIEWEHCLTLRAPFCEGDTARVQ